MSPENDDDRVGVIAQTLETTLASMGFFVTAATEAPHQNAGVTFSRLGANGSSNLRLVVEPCAEGATIRMSLLSPFGDWASQDLDRWGLPSLLPYTDITGLLSQRRTLARALKPILEQIDGLVSG
jgi:hypothetical protein